MENSVLNKNVNTKRWLKSAGVRAVKTMAQTCIGIIGASTLISEVSWGVVLSGSILSGIISLLTSIAGIPEVKAENE